MLARDRRKRAVLTRPSSPSSRGPGDRLVCVRRRPSFPVTGKLASDLTVFGGTGNIFLAHLPETTDGSRASASTRKLGGSVRGPRRPGAGRDCGHGTASRPEVGGPAWRKTPRPGRPGEDLRHLLKEDPPPRRCRTAPGWHRASSILAWTARLRHGVGQGRPKALAPWSVSATARGRFSLVQALSGRRPRGRIVIGG